MGDFCEKSHFSPLRSWKYLNIPKKSEKKRLAGPGLEGRGCHQGEKYFFAFLDELDRLEAKKIFDFVPEVLGSGLLFLF